MTEFEKDIREKKQIGNSARHKVVGGGRRVGFPSDGLTKKERETLSSEVRSWNTKRVMPWGTYKQMPGDLQKEYLTNMQGCGATAKWLAAAMGVTSQTVWQDGKRHGVAFPRGGGDRVLWERNLDLWRNGETARQEPAHEEDAAPEETPKKQTALLHARLELDGDRESILSHLRLLMPDEGRVTVEW